MRHPKIIIAGLGVALAAAVATGSAASTSPFVFVSERGGPLSPDMIARIVERAGESAKLGFHVHPTCCGTRQATRWPMRGPTHG